jgi:hypothetical protein
MCIYPSRVFQCHRSHLGDSKLLEVPITGKLPMVYNGLSGKGKEEGSRKEARRLDGSRDLL